MVLQPPYKYSERPCDLRKVGLDTRLFTSPHTMELLRVILELDLVLVVSNRISFECTKLNSHDC